LIIFFFLLELIITENFELLIIYYTELKFKEISEKKKDEIQKQKEIEEKKKEEERRKFEKENKLKKSSSQENNKNEKLTSYSKDYNSKRKSSHKHSYEQVDNGKYSSKNDRDGYDKYHKNERRSDAILNGKDRVDRLHAADRLKQIEIEKAKLQKIINEKEALIKKNDQNDTNVDRRESISNDKFNGNNNIFIIKFCCASLIN